MANNRQKKKQRKKKEAERLQAKINVNKSIDEIKEKIKQFEEEMKDETIVIEDTNESKLEEIKTEDDFSNKLDNILSQNTEDKKEETEDEKKKATSTAEKIAEEYKDTETFTMKDITKLMKNSGLSYRQIVQQMKAIGKATEEYAATQGDDFDRKEFLRKQMEQRLGKK